MTPNATTPTATPSNAASALTAPTAAFALVNRPRPATPALDRHDTATGTAPAATAVADGVLEPSYSIRELAALLHVTTQTLYDLRYQGRGPTAFRVGRHLRFRHSEVTAWLEGLEAEDRGRHDHDFGRDPGREPGPDRQGGQGSGWR